MIPDLSKTTLVILLSVLLTDSTNYYMGDSRFGLPSYCVCIEEDSSSSSSSQETSGSAVFTRDTLDTTVDKAEYTLYSVMFSIDKTLGYCVTETMQMTPFPVLRRLSLYDSVTETQQNMLEQLAFLHLEASTLTEACISFVLNVTSS